MNVHEFIASRPCLEEIDGFLDGLRLQARRPDIWGADRAEKPNDPDVLAALSRYKADLMDGKEVPHEGRGRAYIYKRGRKPVLQRSGKAQG